MVQPPSIANMWDYQGERGAALAEKGLSTASSRRQCTSNFDQTSRSKSVFASALVNTLNE